MFPEARYSHPGLDTASATEAFRSDYPPRRLKVFSPFRMLATTSRCVATTSSGRSALTRTRGSLGQNWRRKSNEAEKPARCAQVSGGRGNRGDGTVADDRVGHALALWRESVDPRGTLAERYLVSRGLQLADEVAGNVLRWHARIGAAVALFRNVETNRPQAVTRIYLDSDGNKTRRAFLGPVRGAAIKIDADDAVTNGLHIGEGVETCMAAHQLGLRPCWALGSAGAIAAFPVLRGVEALTILAEHDDASARAVDACAARWHAAGRGVLINEPIGGKDLNDAIRATAAP